MQHKLLKAVQRMICTDNDFSVSGLHAANISDFSVFVTDFYCALNNGDIFCAQQYCDIIGSFAELAVFNYAEPSRVGAVG